MISRLEVPLKHRTLYATGDILLDQLLIYCDGTPSPAAIHGNLIVETK